MKKSITIGLTICAFVLVGALIVAWSVHKKGDAGKHVVKVKNFTDENFERDVVEASKSQPVLVDFYAEWCYPCKMLDPILEEVARETLGRAVIGKIDTDRNLIPRRFGIDKIPAIFIIRDGEIKESFLGVVPKETIMKALAASPAVSQPQ
jgi:thioredoxin